MKGADRWIRMILIILKKKNFKASRPFWAEKQRIVIAAFAVRIFFQILHNEKGQQVDESNNNGLH